MTERHLWWNQHIYEKLRDFHSEQKRRPQQKDTGCCVFCSRRPHNWKDACSQNKMLYAHRPVKCEKLAIRVLDSHWVFSPSLLGMPPMASMATGLPGVPPLPLPPLPVGVSPPLVSSAPPTLPPPIANGAPPTGMIQPITGFSHPGKMHARAHTHVPQTVSCVRKRTNSYFTNGDVP